MYSQRNEHSFARLNASTSYPRTEDEETKSNNVWLKGHTDIGSVTILWSQPISALQILSPDGKWRWIRHIDNALVSKTRSVVIADDTV